MLSIRPVWKNLCAFSGIWPEKTNPKTAIVRYKTMHPFLRFFSAMLLTTLVWGSLQAQGVIDGTWMGSIHQDRVPTPADFKVRLELKQTGNAVTGRTYIHEVGNPEYRAVMALKGNFYGAMLVFEETHFISKYSPLDWEWCLKSGRLFLKRQGQYWRLEGKVEGHIGDVECVASNGTFERLDPIGRPDSAKTKTIPKPKVDSAVVVKPHENKHVPVPPPTPVDGKLDGRKITHQRDVYVHQRELELLIWDSDKEDGDIVSLSYNGQWLLRNHTVNKTRKSVKIQVEPGKENQLILYAENEGTAPPNTAALTFFDGLSTRNLNLSSTKSTCGALRFIVQP